MTYRLAERFHSIQGEGLYTGTPMHFIRLAGCNVGKFYYRPDYDKWPKDLCTQVLQNRQHSVCTTALGQKFLCDTDYLTKFEASVEELVQETYEERVCLTGGEPFIHDLLPLVVAFIAAGKSIHIETSGTKLIPEILRSKSDFVWITCSPKKGHLRENNKFISEFKFIFGDPSRATPVTELFDLIAIQIEHVIEGCKSGTPVFIQPINTVSAIDPLSLELVQQFLSCHPIFRLSLQLHKVIGVR